MKYFLRLPLSFLGLTKWALTTIPRIFAFANLKESREVLMSLSYVSMCLQTSKAPSVAGNERECVRDQFNGRRIVNNIVEFLFEPFREFLHGAAFEEFVRAGGRSSLINDVKVFVFFGGAENLLKGGLPGEIIAQSRDGLFLKVFGNTPFPNIGVNQDYFHIRDGEHKSQIDGNRRFFPPRDSWR